MTRKATNTNLRKSSCDTRPHNAHYDPRAGFQRQQNPSSDLTAVTGVRNSPTDTDRVPEETASKKQKTGHANELFLRRIACHQIHRHRWRPDPAQPTQKPERTPTPICQRRPGPIGSEKPNRFAEKNDHGQTDHDRQKPVGKAVMFHEVTKMLTMIANAKYLYLLTVCIRS